MRRLRSQTRLPLVRRGDVMSEYAQSWVCDSDSRHYTPNMCGIVGYVGRAEAAPILLDGLRRLEYRGYDSAGIAIVDGDRLETRKCAGRIAALAN